MRTRCWCEYVNGRRHVADGCPTHDRERFQFEHLLSKVIQEARHYNDQDDLSKATRRILIEMLHELDQHGVEGYA